MKDFDFISHSKWKLQKTLLFVGVYGPPDPDFKSTAACFKADFKKAGKKMAHLQEFYLVWEDSLITYKESRSLQI